MSITKDNQLLYATGHGPDSTGAPVTAASPIPIASVGKSFTAPAARPATDMLKIKSAT